MTLKWMVQVSSVTRNSGQRKYLGWRTLTMCRRAARAKEGRLWRYCEVLLCRRQPQVRGCCWCVITAVFTPWLVVQYWARGGEERGAPATRDIAARRPAPVLGPGPWPPPHHRPVVTRPVNEPWRKFTVPGWLLLLLTSAFTIKNQLRHYAQHGKWTINWDTCPPRL